MNEILKNLVLVFGAIYLLYHVGSFAARLIKGLIR